MFDYNHFKRVVKTWMSENPEASPTDLRDFCEDQIPPQQYQAHEWLVDQTLAWYSHIQASRKMLHPVGMMAEEGEDDIA